MGGTAHPFIRRQPAPRQLLEPLVQRHVCALCCNQRLGPLVDVERLQLDGLPRKLVSYNREHLHLPFERCTPPGVGAPQRYYFHSHVLWGRPGLELACTVSRSCVTSEKSKFKPMPDNRTLRGTGYSRHLLTAAGTSTPLGVGALQWDRCVLWGCPSLYLACTAS